MLNSLKAWTVPLLRTGLAVFLASLIAGLVRVDFAHFHVTDLNALGSLVLGALGMAANAVVIGVQKVLPGVPDPVPPTVAPSGP